MALDYVTSGYVLTLFLVILGLLHIYLSTKVDDEQKKIRVVTMRFLLTAFGFLYISLSFLFLFISVGNSLYLTYDAPCENLLKNTTVSGNITTYTYADSCAGMQPPVTMERFYKILGYAFLLEFTIICIAFLYIIGAWLFTW